MGRIILWPLVVAVSIVAASPSRAGIPGPPEPYWNSKPLSFWLQALAVGEPLRRVEAAQSVAEIAIAHGGAIAAGAVPALVGNLSDPEPSVRRSAARALEQIGPAARPAVPALMRMFAGDAASDARRGAGLALGRIDATTGDVVRQAARALDDRDPGVRESAAVLLMASGPAASAAGDALERALADGDEIVRLYAATAIARAGAPDRCVPLVLDGLRSSNSAVRAETAGLLAEFAPGRPQIVQALTNALRDDEAQVRAAAADALGAIGKPARPALDTLWSMLRDPDENVRESVLKAARHIRDMR
jgi:HEAT repeat protein